MKSRDIVCLGASAGGLEAITTIASELPASLPAALFVVVHIPADHRSYLGEILSSAGPLKAVSPNDGEFIRHGRIFVAPPIITWLSAQATSSWGRGQGEPIPAGGRRALPFGGAQLRTSGDRGGVDGHAR